MAAICVECQKAVAVLFEQSTKKKMCLACFRDKGKPPATVIHVIPLRPEWEECFLPVSVLPLGTNVKFEPR